MKHITFIALAAMASANLIAQNTNTEEQEVRSIISTLETGWNTKSGETFSSVFAEKHDYIVVNGLYFSNFNPKSNSFAHQGLFNGMYKNVDIKLKVDKVNFIRPDLAMIHALGAGIEKGKPVPADPTIIMTVLAEKQNGEWRIISFHNHNLETFKDKTNSPMPLNVMYASWYKN